MREISGSFVLLTPQFIYDGFVCEGEFKPSFNVTLNKRTSTIVRDQQDEKAFVEYLQSCHPNFARQSNSEYYLSFAEAEKKHWFLKLCKKFFEDKVELVGLDMLKHFRYSPHEPVTSLTVIEKKEHFISLNMEVRFGKEKVPLFLLQKSVLDGQKVVVLENGSFGVLTDEWMERFSALIRHGRIQDNTITVSAWLFFTEDNAGVYDLSENFSRKDWIARWQKWKNETEQQYPLPSGIVLKELRSYQRKGYEWLRLLCEAGAGACLADDMGLGKTIQTICFLVHRLESGASRKHLVICPTSLMYNWKVELEKFSPHTKVMVYHGSQRAINIFEDDHPLIVLTSYGTVRNDIGLLAKMMFDTIVLDESHNIKNPGALLTKAVGQLQAYMRIVLSGTPVMNDTFDLFAQLNFVLPGLLGGQAFFKKQYADPIDHYKEESKIKALQKLTAPFILRRTKEQVAPDLPAKTETILWCSMKAEQRELYENIRQTIRGNLFAQVKQKGIAANSLTILQGLLKLRQVCNSCELIKDEGINSRESIKTTTLINEMVSITENHKVLVFSQFTSMLDILERELERNRIALLRLDGNTPASKRQELVERFNDVDADERIFLLSLKAGNAGLNLTAADYVFLFDPWWNTAVEQQAVDRTHRIGQTKSVFAYKMICKDTIEEKILNLQHQKKKLSEELIAGEDSLIQQLTEEDLNYLFA